MTARGHLYTRRVEGGRRKRRRKSGGECPSAGARAALINQLLHSITASSQCSCILTLSLPMSDLHKSFARSKLASLPPDPPSMPDHDDDSSSASSAGTVVPSPTQNLFTRPGRGYVSQQSDAPELVSNSAGPHQPPNRSLGPTSSPRSSSSPRRTPRARTPPSPTMHT
jgi:hypothetical protein